MKKVIKKNEAVKKIEKLPVNLVLDNVKIQEKINEIIETINKWQK